MSAAATVTTKAPGVATATSAPTATAAASARVGFERQKRNDEKQRGGQASAGRQQRSRRATRPRALLAPASPTGPWRIRRNEERPTSTWGIFLGCAAQPFPTFYQGLCEEGPAIRRRVLSNECGAPADEAQSHRRNCSRRLPLQPVRLGT